MQERNKRKTGMAKGAVLWIAALALAWIGAGCSTTRIDQQRVSFEEAMGRGNLEQAENAVKELAQLKVDTTQYVLQLDQAKSNAWWFGEGRRSIHARDFAKVSGAWNHLSASLASWTAQADNPATLWSQSYLSYLNRQMDEFKKQWDKAKADYVKRTKGLFEGHVAAHEWAEAEKQLEILRGLGEQVGDLEQRLENAKKAEKLHASFDKHLKAKEFEKAGEDLAALEQLGEDVGGLRNELVKQHAADLEARIRDAIAGERFDDAEVLLAELDGLGRDTKALRAQLKEARIAQHLRFFGEALAARDFDRCESEIGELEALGRDASGEREQLRQGRVASIREAMEEDWTRNDTTAVAEKRDRLAELGDNVDDITERLVITFKSETDRLVQVLLELVGPEAALPNKDGAQEAIRQYEIQWGPIFRRDNLSGDLILQARAEYEAAWARVTGFYANCDKMWILVDEGKASEGLSGDGKWQRWIRCLPHQLLEDERYNASNMKVHLLGYARHIRREAGKSSLYRLEGMDGAFIDVATDFPPPQEGDIVYVLATTEMQDGKVFLLREHEAHRPAKHYGEIENGIEVPTRYDIEQWMNCEYDFMLENLFRRYVCVQNAKALPVMTYGEWVNGKRTTALEAEEFFRAQ